MKAFLRFHPDKGNMGCKFEATEITQILNECAEKEK